MKALSKDWFSVEEINKKRGEIGRLIETLAQEEHQGTLTIPLLKYDAPVKVSKKLKWLFEDE